jgi:hypothetical protein
LEGDKVMAEWLVFIGSIIGLIMASGAVFTWIGKSDDPCKHSYERIDSYNDKKIILVCRKCGKIKKLRR